MKARSGTDLGCHIVQEKHTHCEQASRRADMQLCERVSLSGSMSIRLCLCVCLYVDVYAYIYVDAYRYVYVHCYVYVYLAWSMPIRLCLHIRSCLCLCLYKSVSIRPCECLCVGQGSRAAKGDESHSGTPFHPRNAILEEAMAELVSGQRVQLQVRGHLPMNAWNRSPSSCIL